MKKLIALGLGTAMALSATSAFAGLTLATSNPNYNANTVKVKCTDSSGNVLGDRNAIINQNVGWVLVNAGFLKLKSSGHCVFTYTTTGAIMGEGDVAVQNNSQGKISNIDGGQNYIISVQTINQFLDNGVITLGRTLNADEQNKINALNNRLPSLQAKLNTLNQQLNTKIQNINNNIASGAKAKITAQAAAAVTTAFNNQRDQTDSELNQQLNHEIDQQLNAEAIASGLDTIDKRAIATAFDAGSGKLYIRGFSSDINDDGEEVLSVYSYHPEINFCSDSAKVDTAFATLNMNKKYSTVVASYLMSMYAAGKPVHLKTRASVYDGMYNCPILGILNG
ncbi:MAG: hypothetical protein ACO2ZM_02105 [Francisellaceae bacterium]